MSGNSKFCLHSNSLVLILNFRGSCAGQGCAGALGQGVEAVAHLAACAGEAGGEFLAASGDA